MPYNYSSKLWPNREEHFYRDRSFKPIKQEGPHCVSIVLAMLTGIEPVRFQASINTQDPISWSDALFHLGMRLAYCPTDARKLRFYMNELLRIDDLFTLSYYTPNKPTEILQDPDENGWLCSSHIVILHRREILDPALGTAVDVFQHKCNDYHTKRIFRVVPSSHSRGL